MNRYATCLPIFLFFIKVATTHRSPYALIWNWGFGQIYIRWRKLPCSIKNFGQTFARLKPATCLFLTFKHKIVFFILLQKLLYM